MELQAPSQSGRWRGLNRRILEWAMTRTGCQRGKESGISKANIFWWCFKSGYKGEETVRGTVRVPPSVATRSRRTLRIYVIRNEFGENATRSNFPRRAILTYIRFFFQLRLYTLYDIAVIRKFSRSARCCVAILLQLFDDLRFVLIERSFQSLFVRRCIRQGPLIEWDLEIDENSACQIFSYTRRSSSVIDSVRSQTREVIDRSCSKYSFRQWRCHRERCIGNLGLIVEVVSFQRRPRRNKRSDQRAKWNFVNFIALP